MTTPSGWPTYRLVDLPSGTTLAQREGWNDLIRGPVREILEHEGRERASTLAVRGGYRLRGEEDVHLTGEALAQAAFDEPQMLEVEPLVRLEPTPFDTEAYLALPEAKLELIEGVLYGDYQVRATMLRALLANVGLREAIKLAPRDTWLEALAQP
jgi:hypothetical protein